MKIAAQSVDEYLSLLEPERREIMEKLRHSILSHLPEGFVETINYDMIGYVVPHALYPEGYHCNPADPLPFINIAAQKNFIALYHMGIYASKELYDWFIDAYAVRCKYKLDMGKSCIRFKKFDDIPYDLIGELVEKITVNTWISQYEALKPKKK